MAAPIGSCIRLAVSPTVSCRSIFPAVPPSRVRLKFPVISGAPPSLKISASLFDVIRPVTVIFAPAAAPLMVVSSVTPVTRTTVSFTKIGIPVVCVLAFITAVLPEPKNNIPAPSVGAIPTPRPNPSTRNGSGLPSMFMSCRSLANSGPAAIACAGLARTLIVPSTIMRPSPTGD